MNFKYVIVGAGLSGLTMAERIANVLQEKVLVIEKRNHIGGNVYDSYNEDGILIHNYGPHIFHTNSQSVYQYLSQFTQWNDFWHRVLTYVDGNLIPMPITVETINKLYNLNLDCSQVEDFLKKQAVEIDEVTTSKEVALSKVGPDIYSKIFENYTKKQWGIDPAELDTSVISRIPIRLNRDTRYFADRYQGMPKFGYTKMCEKMAANKNIKIMLNTDYKEVIGDISYEKLIYTGPADDYYDYKYGRLSYRSIHFAFETYDKETFQEAPVVNYPNDYDYTRITEFKKLTWQEHRKTTICKEFPCAEGEPYYPFPTKDCKAQFALYAEEMKKESKVIFLGRLAEYKYYNMDAAVKRALDVFEQMQKAAQN
ncbi:MAG TPA: UDP-galactopyranose mutase [Lachnospiraceae bacterium]|jgi:UDP-galactopyranose mutase|nr:UDP-galactopyranose mutase [Lachnospiraceae bacterium]HBY71353.1 UDP-galactopyranose mutase [Lachnospiraceae bacterium]HCA70662.1 UDP-galactopyranose mutase [Lachnospiraceae bacterium]HCM13383.1 UDP-galactopyranose mutase [Lachnospiraceae bacterium]HCR40449.1 UDP-galactopyranose mutase [Lachnospiraceae bacterium]